MSYLFLFLFGLVFDTLWVLCIHFVSIRNKSIYYRHFATLTSVILAGLGALSGAMIAFDKWLIIPEVLGMTLGMYIGMYVADIIERMEDNR